MKKILAILLVLAMIFALTACGKKEAAPAPAATTPAASTPASSGSSGSSSTPAPAPAATDLKSLKPVNVILPTAASNNAIETIYTEKWMELVTERSDGQITFDYTNASAMGTFAELLEGVDNNVYNMTLMEMSYYESYVPETGMLFMPYMYTGYDCAKKILLGDIGDWYRDLIAENTNTQMMNFFPCYFRWINTNKELHELEDCKGILIRVPGIKLYEDIFNMMGFSPVALGWSDVYTGMSTGIVNGVETTGESIYNYGFYKFAPYVCKSRHLLVTESIIANQDFWNSLPTEYQEIMSKAMDDTTAEEWQACIDKEDTYIESLESEGVTITEFSDSAKAELSKMFEEYWYTKAAGISDECNDILAQMIKLR